MVLARKRRGGTRALYTFTSFSGQSDFASQKSCICDVAHITKSACPTAAKSVCCHTLPHRRVRRQPLSRVSRKQRYNTLDFAAQNRVPTGMLRAPIGNPAAKRFSLCNPSFPSQVHIQTAKGSLSCLLRKCKRQSVPMYGTDFLLGGNAEGMDGSFLCIPAIRTAGTRDNERGKSQYSKARDGSI